MWSRVGVVISRRRFATVRPTSPQFGGISDKVRYRPRRAVLYMPGSSEKMLGKVSGLEVDCAVLELEDGVAAGEAKVVARRNVRAALDRLAGQTIRPLELAVRVNSVASELISDDLHELAQAKVLPDAFVIPKIESTADVVQVWEAFRAAYGDARIQGTNTRLVGMVESARAMLDMPAICAALLNLHRNSNFFKLDAVIFGSDDYCADIGAERSATCEETAWARQRFVACCRAFQLQPIDAVHIDLKDDEGLARTSVQSRKWGFAGRQTIHPAQVPIAQRAYTPPVERIKWARELVTAFAEHERSAKGAFNFRGQMIDRPLLLQALNVVQLAERIGAE